MSKAAKVVNISLFCVWFFLISLVLYKEYAGQPLGKTQALKGSLSKVTHWYDIYSGSNKVGFSSYTFEWVGDEVIIEYEQEMRIKQAEGERILFESSRCVTNSFYAIKSFEYSSHFKDEKGIKVTGEVDSDHIVFILDSSEKKKTFRASMKGRDLYIPTTFIPAIIQRNPSPHSVFTVAMLDMVNLSISETRVVVEEIRPVKWGTQIVSFYKLRAGSDVFWSNDKGVTVKEEYPGLTLYAQTEDMAKDPGNRVLFDYVSLPFVKSNKILKNAENMKLFRVRIKGFPLDPSVYENSLVTLKNDTLIIRREDVEEFKKSSFTLPCKDPVVSRYLSADEWVLSADKTIKGNAINMAIIEKNDAFRLARYLNSNLYMTVRTMPLFVLTNSLDTFKSKFGDYLQRTVMFASFARAAGLPTRFVGGIVYRSGYFYFHTWPEVWFGKWIPTDPTLAQFPADVTHVPLGEGTLKAVISMAEGLKTLDIEILEAS